MANKHLIYKNLTCLFFCLVTIFITTIFVSETYYNRIINEQIQEASILNSIHFQDWASMQAPSSVIHKFQPYAYDKNGKPSLLNQSFKYQYTYEYKNVSFTQGNTGSIRYLNNWKRQLIVSQQQAINNDDHKIRVFNVDAQTVYNYDYFAPDIRRFALGYNILKDMLSKDFLLNFYGYYTFEYMFKNFTMVQSRIFTPLKLQKQQSQQIYSHPIYGLGNPNSLSLWVQLGDKIQDQSFYTSRFYKGIRQELKLTQSQVLYIAGQKSTLRGLYMAIKGALKFKLQSFNGIFCNDVFCRDQELVAAQISEGVLTKNYIFPTTKINKYANQLNNTLFDNIQFSAFCEKRTDLKCGEPQNLANFFAGNHLSKYSQVEYIFKNFDNPGAIQKQYEIKEAGAAMIQYVKYLYNNVFNIPIKQSKQQNSSQNMRVEEFKRSFTNYNHIQSILDKFKQLLYIQLHARAFYNKFINSDEKVKCEDYYNGDFQASREDCQKIPMNTASDITLYLEAYFDINSDKLTNRTTMQPALVYEFLHNPQKSKFAQQAIQLQQDLKNQYSCKSNTCNEQQLMLKEWEKGSVLSNLPAKYFGNQTKQSILSWDQQGVLNGIQPQIFNFLTIPQEIEAEEILSSISGVYSLFNLMKVYNDPHGQIYQGIPNRDLLYYLQNLVLQVQFKGMYLTKTPKQLFTQYKSQIIERKRSMGDALGGASWLNPNISVIKLQNKPQKFNFINSGIYGSQKLRTLSLIQDSLCSSSVYQVFKSDTQDVKVLYQSDKKVSGTNLFGFQTKIQQHDTIQGYFQMIYQSQPLGYRNTQSWRTLDNQEIQAFRFVFPSTKEFQVGVQQLRNRTVQLNGDSYFIVQPQTGLTLQMYIKYVVYSKPFYLQNVQRNQTSSLPLYQGQIYYVNHNTDKIVQIHKDKNILSLLFLWGIVLSSISIVAFAIMLVLYRRASRLTKPRDEKRSLLDSEVQASSVTM